MAVKAFDEMNSGAVDGVRAPYRGVADWLARTSPDKVAATRHEVDQFYRRHGITFGAYGAVERSEEHTSELQSLRHLVCRLLLEKKNKTTKVRLQVTKSTYNTKINST